MLKKGSCALIILFIFLRPLLPQNIKNSESPQIKSRYWERQGKITFFSGDVELHYKDLKIYADYMEFNEETQELVAEGNVSIHMREQIISGNKIIFNLKTRQGKIISAKGMIQPTTFFKAESMERIEENTYNFNNATLTTCNQPIPRWKFTCSRGKLKQDEYLELRNSFLWIKKIPVFYIPYLKYPLKRRSTGFLAPELGYSGYKGYSIGQGFFWAISRNMDATINLDYYSEQGIGSGLEYRYIFSENTKGNLNFYYFKYLKRPELNYDYLIRFHHNQELFYGFKLIANIDHQSSLYFLKEFDNNFNRATISTYMSQAYIVKNWPNINFTLRADRTETYFSRANVSRVVYHLPQVNLELIRTKLIEPFYFSISSSYDNVHRIDGSLEYGINRLRISPSLSLPFSKIPWLSFNLDLSLRQTYYYNYTQKKNSKILKKIQDLISTRYYVAKIDIVGPTFYRIYSGAKGTSFEKFKHVIEPHITYQYSAKIGEGEKIVLFDYYDYPAYHQFGYSLVNRLFIKKKETPLEILTWSIGQTYYFKPEEVLQLKHYKINDETPHFSDIYSTLRISPSPKYSIDFNLYYNPYYNKLSRVYLVANLGVPEDNLFMRISWTKRKIFYKSEYFFGNYNQIRFFAGFKIPKLKLESNFEIDHDFLLKKTQYLAVSVIYHYQCIDFKGEIKMFYFREKPEIQYRVAIGLGNITTVTDFLGGIGF